MTEPPAEHEVPPEFREAVSELLYQSQMLEGLLKAYLADLNEAADECVRLKGFRFKPREKELRKATLGTLVNQYKAHSDVDWLSGRLNAFVQFRNTAAHTAFVWGFVHRESREKIADAVTQIRAKIVEAKTLVEAMTIETIRSYELKTGKTVSAPPVDKAP